MTLFKDRFDEKEQQSKFQTLFLGLSFITEGAIPFAAKEPLKVIGSCVIGAAIAGGLTQFGVFLLLLLMVEYLLFLQCQVYTQLYSS